MSQLRTLLTRRHPRCTAGTLVALVTIVPLAACSTPAASPGVDEETVTIGTHTPLTGPDRTSVV